MKRLVLWSWVVCSDGRYDSLNVGVREEICRTYGALNFSDIFPRAYALG
jgi:hypothetical protein